MNTLMTINETTQEAAVCYGFGALVEFIDENTYSASNHTYLATDCNIEENRVFEGMYTSVLDTQEGLLSNYSYEIGNDTNGDKTLIVTNEFGDTAVFGDQILLTDSPSTYSISVFPNPTNDKLNIITDQSDGISGTLFDIHGTKLMAFI